MYKSFKLILFALVFSFGISFPGYAQTPEFKNVELVNIVTDRLLYLSGETIWFAADYCVQADVNVSISKVLYVDLYNNEKQLVKKQKFRINNGYVEGKIDLSEQLNTGFYILRAYTRYQTNFPVWQLSSVVLKVVNPFHPLNSRIDSQSVGMKISTSNSGNVIFGIDQPLAGIVDRVNLICKDQIIDTNMLYFRNGLGKSLIIPDSDTHLKLQVILTNGDTIHSDEELVKLREFVFSVIPDGNEIEFDISLSGMNKELLSLSMFNLKNRNNTSATAKVRDGKVHLTISDKENLTGLNLISFISEGGDTLMETFIVIDSDYDVKQNIEIQNFSVDSILIDLHKYPSDLGPISISFVMDGVNYYDDYILPEYLIMNPQFAPDFVYNDMLLNEQLESLSILSSSMLLQGLEFSTSTDYLVIPEIDGLTVQGKMVMEKGQSYTSEKVYCSVLGDDPQFHVTTTNNDGRFIIPINQYTGNKDIYIVTDFIDHEIEKVDIESGYFHSPPIWTPVSFIPDTSMRRLLTDMYVNYQINKVYNIEKEEVSAENVSYLPLFAGNLKEIFLSDYVELATTQELFNEVVPFVKVKKKSGDYSFSVLDDDFNIQYNNPLILLDNIYFPDINQIMNFQPTEIISVGVMNKPYAYGNSVFNGIISITTSADNFDGVTLPMNGVFFDYDSEVDNVNFVPFMDIQENHSKPDYAVTVFWKVVNPSQFSDDIYIKLPKNRGSFELVITSLQDSKVLVRKQY